jgi:hypothetical protein
MKHIAGSWSSFPMTFQEMTIRLLQLLILSERPLRLDEAVNAVAVRLYPVPGFDKEDRWLEPSDMILLCSSLISIQSRPSNELDFERHLNSVSGPDDHRVVQLAHFSVKEFLLSNNAHGIHKSFASHVANAEVAKVLLAYLTNLDFDLPIP